MRHHLSVHEFPNRILVFENQHSVMPFVFGKAGFVIKYDHSPQLKFYA